MFQIFEFLIISLVGEETSFFHTPSLQGSVSRYMHTSLMGVVLTSPYIPTSTLWLKE